MGTSTWPKAHTGTQIMVGDFVKATRVCAGSFGHQHPARDGFKIGAKVDAAFYRDDALLRRINTYMLKDRLIQTLAPHRTDDNTDIGRGIQYLQHRHGAQAGSETTKHGTGKRKFAITEILDAKATLKGILIILTGLTA
tara:strand:+ start:163 stop:579 length:417 start_codon:yes stop_codon:yes gene_type:complete